LDAGRAEVAGFVSDVSTKQYVGPQAALGVCSRVRPLPRRLQRSLKAGLATTAITESGKERVGIGIGVSCRRKTSACSALAGCAMTLRGRRQAQQHG